MTPITVSNELIETLIKQNELRLWSLAASRAPDDLKHLIALQIETNRMHAMLDTRQEGCSD